MSKWDGIDRRKEGESIYTVLARIDERLKVALEDVDKLKDSVAWQQKILYGGLGIIAFLHFLK